MIAKQVPMIAKRKYLHCILCGCLIFCSLNGCTAHHEKTTQKSIFGRASSSMPADHQFWWNCRFKIHWPSGQDPDLTIDLLIAHGVVFPVINEHIDKISYWRFHRRARRDTAGHQFSFMFYADPQTASEIFEKIQRNDILRKAKASHMVEMLLVDNVQKPSRPDIKDKSDRHWSPLMQKTWPYYIMGVSSLWLELIKEVMADVSLETDNVWSLLEHYRKADARVTSIWYKEGQHALLHHLNAIFGYSPLLINKQMRF
jgi:hypothetical protein